MYIPGLRMVRDKLTKIRICQCTLAVNPHIPGLGLCKIPVDFHRRKQLTTRSESPDGRPCPCCRPGSVSSPRPPEPVSLGTGCILSPYFCSTLALAFAVLCSSLSCLLRCFACSFAFLLSAFFVASSNNIPFSRLIVETSRASYGSRKHILVLFLH